MPVLVQVLAWNVAGPWPGWHRADTRWQQRARGAGRKKGGEPVKVSPHFQGQRWEKLECGGCERAAGHAACHRRHILEENKGESAPRKEGRKEEKERKRWQERSPLPSSSPLFGVETPRNDKTGRHVWLPSPLPVLRTTRVLLDSLFKQRRRNLRSPGRRTRLRSSRHKSARADRTWRINTEPPLKPAFPGQRGSVEEDGAA